MQALYRKYRSKTLDELVGQEHITTTLARAIKSGRISHAYLLTGPKGVGKTSVARILAHEINQLPYTDEVHLDIIEIDAASNRRIDDIRDLRDKVHIAPTAAKYKVYIIDEVHMLTGESFNALLKTLEEPPEHVVFILATTEVHKLPATIISRTQRYSFHPVEHKKVVAHLKHIAQQEKIKINDDALELIAEHGEGSFRDSISLLDQLANVSGSDINVEIVEQNLGLAPKAAIETLVTGLKHTDYKATVNNLQGLEDQGVTTASLIPQLIRALQQVAPSEPQLYDLIDALLEVPRAYNPSVKLLTTLVAYCVKYAPKDQTSKPAIAQAVKPLLEITKQPKSSKKEAKVIPPIEKLVVTGNKPLPDLSINQWAEVLARIKVTSAPLYGIFRQAEPQFDATQQTLTLTFKYQLHRKRADEPKAKNELTKALLAILGGAPVIMVAVNPGVSVPDFTIPTIPLDDVTKSVAAIMGGGEAIRG